MHVFLRLRRGCALCCGKWLVDYLIGWVRLGDKACWLAGWLAGDWWVLISVVRS